MKIKQRNFGMIWLIQTALCTAATLACDLGPVELERTGVVVEDSGEDALVAARTAGDAPGEPDNMFLRYHVRLANPGATDLTLVAPYVGIRVDGLDEMEPYVLDDGDDVIEANDHDVYKFEHTSTGAMIEGAGFIFNYSGLDDSTVLGWPVVAYQNATAPGGYNFPARLEDLHPTEFWSQGRHAHATHQAYALDLGVRRWRNGELTRYTEKAFDDQASGIEIGSRNDHFSSWGRPVYAMHGGTVTKCRRLQPDNVPGNTTSGANLVVVDHGNGEYAAYVHFMEDSISADLCPTEVWGDDILDPPVQVEGGQFLGLVGNSGPSSGPHLHLAVSDVPHYESENYTLPINFGGVAVHGKTGFDLDASALNAVSWSNPRAMGTHQVLRPNTTGWPEADLPLGSLYRARDGVFCASREGGQDRIRVELEPGADVDLRSACNLAAEVEVVVGNDWTLDIDAHERSGVGRSLFLRSWNSSVTNKRNLVLEWVKLKDGANYVYQVQLTRLDAGTTQNWLLEGSGHLFVSVGKNSMTFNYGNAQETAGIGFVGVGSSKSASLYSWEANDNSL